MKGLGVVAFVALGLSAWCGAIAAKLYVSYQLPFNEMIAVNRGRTVAGATGQ